MTLDFKLSEEEVRVLSVLIEKQITTPAGYPMSVNAIKTGCNQKTNREPVVKYTEEDVLDALDDLRKKQLAGTTSGMSSRVMKYRHLFNQRFKLTLRETVVMCLLMLRGPQTTGELRSRSGRMFDFENLDEVEQTCQGLTEGEEPLVVELEPQPGQKGSRYAHLLSGEPEIQIVSYSTLAPIGSDDQRMAQLEQEVETLKTQLEALKTAFEAFRRQFE